jgi:hypothetical protein
MGPVGAQKKGRNLARIAMIGGVTAAAGQQPCILAAALELMLWQVCFPIVSAAARGRADSRTAPQAGQ